MKSKTSKEIENAVQAISAAAAEAVKTISSAAAEAKSVVAVNAQNAAKVLEISSVKDGSDHDLLQRLDQKVDNIQTTVNKLTDRDSDYVLKNDFIEHLKDYSVLRTEVDNLKTVTTKIWSYGVAGIFMVALIEFALKFIIK
jgi:hypothetical protein